MDINFTLVKVLFLSITIGLIVAYTGYFFIKVVHKSFDQLIVVYLIVVVSFFIAEHFKIAGILSIVSSVLTLKYLVKNDLSHKKYIFKEHNHLNSSSFFLQNVPALTKKHYREYVKESEYIGIFANAIVFSILATMIDLFSLQKYFKEIIIVFLLTTLIRVFFISIMTWKLHLPARWIVALTFAGMKGALAIIMVHSLPDNFVYKEMFNAIVIGNVLLSTFLYTIFLMIHIRNNKKNYNDDINNK